MNINVYGKATAYGIAKLLASQVHCAVRLTGDTVSTRLVVFLLCPHHDLFQNELKRGAVRLDEERTL
jgi:hypothetical protein